MTWLKNLRHSIAGVDWLGVTRMLVIQVIVLSVLSLAVLRYIEWTSQMAQAEFMGMTGQTIALASAKHAPCSAD